MDVVSSEADARFAASRCFQDGQDTSLPALDVDPFSTEYFEDPYPIQNQLREAGPVVILPRYEVLAVGRYEHVHAILNDWQTYCSSRGVGLSDFAKEKPWRPPSLVLETDPPVHDRARSVLAKVLSPVVMKTLRSRFEEAADRLIDKLLCLRGFDGVADLAQAFPLSVFPDVVGMRKEGREHLLPYASVVFNGFGPDNELRRQAIARSTPHVAWVAEQCRKENLEPGGLGAQIHAATDAGLVTRSEAETLVRSLLSAGLDTTVNGIGAAIYCLARFPKAWEALRQNPALARAAFEEAIRFESPVQTFFRTTTRPAVIEGIEIEEGQKILMFLGAANRDPRRWQDPDVYDIQRVTSGHVGFGCGVHMCVGQLLARLEADVVLSALAKRVDKIEIIGTPKRAFNNTLRGLEALPIMIQAA